MSSTSSGGNGYHYRVQVRIIFTPTQGVDPTSSNMRLVYREQGCVAQFLFVFTVLPSSLMFSLTRSRYLVTLLLVFRIRPRSTPEDYTARFATTNNHRSCSIHAVGAAVHSSSGVDRCNQQTLIAGLLLSYPDFPFGPWLAGPAASFSAVGTALCPLCVVLLPSDTLWFDGVV